MNTLDALNLLPQEQLKLAHSYEITELNRYRWLALTFLPYDSTVSLLMKAIGIECLQRIFRLQEVARKMDLDACVNAEKMSDDSVLNKKSKHFFVVNNAMGRQALIRAEEAAKMTCTSFYWLLETNATPELHTLLFNFLKQKNNEYQVLRECREQWKLGSSDLPLAL